MVGCILRPNLNIDEGIALGVETEPRVHFWCVEIQREDKKLFLLCFGRHLLQQSCCLFSVATRKLITFKQQDLLDALT